MPVINDRSNWEVQTESKIKAKGPLVRVEIGPGRFVKMHESDAVKAGHLKKKAPPGKNKLAPPGDNKLAPAPEKKEEPVPDQKGAEDLADDLTEIQGIGPATERALNAHGIESFDDLLNADDLKFLTPKVVESIEKWRSENG